MAGEPNGLCRSARNLDDTELGAKLLARLGMPYFSFDRTRLFFFCGIRTTGFFFVLIIVRIVSATTFT